MSLAYSPSIVTSGLVLCLDAGNIKSYVGSGTTWSDRSLLGNTGTLTSGLTYSSSNGGSIIFTGSTSDYVRMQSDMFNPNADFTISCWVNLSDISTIKTIVSDHVTQGAFQLRFNAASLQIVDANIVNIGTFTGFSASVSTWYNVAVTRSSNTYSLYVNSAYISNFTNSQSYSGASKTIGLNILSSEPFNGKISSIVCYNTVLSNSQIYQNFNALRGRYGI